jgi:DNA-binding MarR family transcriptional regulator
MHSDRIIHLISRTRDRINRDMSLQMGDAGMGDIAPAHAGMLYALGMTGPVAMGELAQVLERDNSTITTLAEKLQKRGYVRKTRSKADSRSYVLELTEKGRLARDRIIQVSRRVLRRFYRGMQGKERRELVRLLYHAYQNFES